MNAMNWCLYSDEPHLSVKSQLLPILNLNTQKESSEGKEEEVTVEIQAVTDDARTFNFKRSAIYIVNEAPELPTEKKNVLEVIELGDEGNSNIIEGKEAKDAVERFIPSKIREYFFFDMEKLEKYFDEISGQNLKNKVITISRIELLTTVEGRLEEVFHEYRKNLAKLNPNTEAIEAEISRNEEKKKYLERQIEQKKIQISTARTSIKEINSELRGAPNTVELEKRREELVKLGEEKETLKKEKIKKKNALLLKFATLIRLWPAIEYSINLIAEKRTNKEIPLKIDDVTLDKILLDKICVCGKKIDFEAEQNLITLKKEIATSSIIANELVSMESGLLRHKDTLKTIEIELDSITADITQYETDIADYDMQIKSIDQQTEGYDPVKIGEKIRARIDFEDLVDRENQNIGRYEKEIEGLKEQIDNASAKLEEETQKVAKAEKLRKNKAFCDQSMKLLSEVKEKIVEETRKRIEDETRKAFFDLIWKTQTYKTLEIDDDYNLKLISAEGYPCLGSAAASERQLVAFAFMLALHKVSGFDAPILIDTPVGRVSDLQRVNFGEALIKSSLKKQMVLLFTKAEYSEDIKKVLAGVGSKMLMAVKPNEKEVEFHVID